MSFDRATTPRNHDFYKSDSPRDGYKYRPQSADSTIYKRVRSAKIIKSKSGRSQKFILIGKSSHPNASYDCLDVAALRVFQSKANLDNITGPAQYCPKTKHIVSKSQIRKYTKPKSRRPRKSAMDKSVNIKGRHIPSHIHHRVTGPKYTNNTKKIWYPCGDAKLIRHPGPGSYENNKIKPYKSGKFTSRSARRISTKTRVKEPLRVVATQKRIQRRKSRNDVYYPKRSVSDWRVSHLRNQTSNHSKKVGLRSS